MATLRLVSSKDPNFRSVSDSLCVRSSPPLRSAPHTRVLCPSRSSGTSPTPACTQSRYAHAYTYALCVCTGRHTPFTCPQNAPRRDKRDHVSPTRLQQRLFDTHAKVRHGGCSHDRATLRTQPPGASRQLTYLFSSPSSLWLLPSKLSSTSDSDAKTRFSTSSLSESLELSTVAGEAVNTATRSPQLLLLAPALVTDVQSSRWTMSAFRSWDKATPKWDKFSSERGHLKAKSLSNQDVYVGDRSLDVQIDCHGKRVCAVAVAGRKPVLPGD
jgi:hypothetical protein